MAGPAIVVVASLTTYWIAATTSDGLVAEDYYKQGLRVSETLERSSKARALGLRGGVKMGADSTAVRLWATQAAEFVAPAQITVTLSHPTRAGVDQIKSFPRRPDGSFEGKLNLPASGHWLLMLEDDAKSWRLLSHVQLPASGELLIGGDEAADIRN